jgi:metal-responsive CopG/Arc/MetJ family transcriptional regulator
MRKTITVSLPSGLLKDLDRAAKADGVSRSDVVRESLRDRLFLRDFRILRKSMLAKAESQGIFTDQDVFDRVS